MLKDKTEMSKNCYYDMNRATVFQHKLKKINFLSLKIDGIQKVKLPFNIIANCI